MRPIMLLFVLLSLFTVPILAQNTPPIVDNIDTSGITDDQVNEVAHQLYCPVCENIPLDACGTAACEDWRQEIRAMLASGMSEEAIIDNFVVRFGDRVVSTPRDPVIRAISIFTPWVALLIAIGVAIYQLLNWNSKNKPKSMPQSEPDMPDTRNSYLEQLEKDLTGK